jgi:hypothetical protein
MMAGANLDITSMDLKGSAISAAHAALVSYDVLKQGKKVVVLAASVEFLSDVENEIKEVTSDQQGPTVACVGPNTIPDPNAQIILSLSSEFSKMTSELFETIIVCEANNIIRLFISSYLCLNLEA